MGVEWAVRARHGGVPGWLRALLPALLLLACQHVPTRIFVVNAGDDTVSVIDGEREREIGVIPVSHFPQGLALSPRAPLLAVANSNGHSVSLIDPVSLEVVEPGIRVGYFPVGMAFGAGGRLLWVANYDSRSVSVIDVEQRRVAGDPVPVPGKPLRLVRSPDGSRLYVLLHQADGAVVVLDTATREVVRRIPVDPFPTDLALRPDGRQLFVASFNANTVTAIDLERLEPVDVFHVQTGHGLLVHPRRPWLYSIRDFDDQVTVFDYERRQEIATIDVGRDPIYSAITPDGRFLYVVNGTDGNVMKVDTRSNQVLVRIAVGAEPSGALVFRPAP